MGRSASLIAPLFLLSFLPSITLDVLKSSKQQFRCRDRARELVNGRTSTLPAALCFPAILYPPFHDMTRVKRGNVARRRRNKILKIAKGFRGSSSTLFRTANQHALKALCASHRDRLQRRRSLRGLWITRINAAVRSQGVKYNDFLFSLRKANMCLNRKVLAQLASRDGDAFRRVVELIHE